MAKPNKRVVRTKRNKRLLRKSRKYRKKNKRVQRGGIPTNQQIRNMLLGYELEHPELIDEYVERVSTLYAIMNDDDLVFGTVFEHLDGLYEESFEDWIMDLNLNEPEEAFENGAAAFDETDDLDEKDSPQKRRRHK